MTHLFAALVASAFCMTAFAQAAAPASDAAAARAQRDKAKEEMVQSATAQGEKPVISPTAAEAKKPSAAQRKQAMEGIDAIGASQAGTNAGRQAAAANKNAPKAAKPDLRDPQVVQKMQAQKP